MDCGKCSELLSEYIDGRLSESEAAAVEAHLKGCASCRKIEAELRETVALVGGLDREPLPFDIAESVASRIERKMLLGEPRAAKRRFIMSPWRLSAVGAAAAACVLVALYVWRPVRTSESAAQPGSGGYDHGIAGQARLAERESVAQEEPLAAEKPDRLQALGYVEGEGGVARGKTGESVENAGRVSPAAAPAAGGVSADMKELKSARESRSFEDAAKDEKGIPGKPADRDTFMRRAAVEEAVWSRGEVAAKEAEAKAAPALTSAYATAEQPKGAMTTAGHGGTAEAAAPAGAVSKPPSAGISLSATAPAARSEAQLAWGITQAENRFYFAGRIEPAAMELVKVAPGKSELSVTVTSLDEVKTVAVKRGFKVIELTNDKAVFDLSIDRSGAKTLLDALAKSTVLSEAKVPAMTGGAGGKAQLGTEVARPIAPEARKLIEADTAEKAQAEEVLRFVLERKPAEETVPAKAQ